MKDLSDRIASLSPEQRALFEARLKRRGLTTPKSQAIPRRKKQNHCRLSFDQERIWIVDQMEPGNPAYNIFSVSRLSGAIDTKLMERALNEIARRHEVMRTTFATVEGEPVQVIAPSIFLPLVVDDLRSLSPEEQEPEVKRRLNEETSRPFDLARGPLVRFGLLRVADNDYYLHYTMHHTVTDRWSADVIEAEMVAIYMAFAEGKPSPLPELPIQYADFTEWQRDWLQGEVLEEQISYWRKQLDGIPHVLELPTDRPRPPVQTYNGARGIRMLSRRTLEGLKELTRQEQATMFMTCLAAYKTLLYRYTRQEDILVGVAVANRNRPETLGLIGYFLNMLVMRTNFSGDPTFREVLRREKESATGAFAHGEFPFGRLMQELKPKTDPSRNPLFQVAYIYLDFPETTDMEVTGIEPSRVQWDNGSSRFEMTLALTDLTDAMEVIIEYNTDLFDAATIERMLGHFAQMVEAIIANPDERVSRLPLLDDAERRRMLVEWNDTASAYPRKESIQQLFEAQAARTPDAVALEFDDARLTYAELNERANRLANHLRAMGVGGEVLVGVMLERSPELVVALLAILKAGGAYVPLDPAYPLERLDFMLKDAQLSVLVTTDELLDNLPSFFGQVVCLDTDADAIEGASAENPSSETTGDNLAYVIYTSGSTGQPKGISISQRAVARLVRETNYIKLEPDDAVAQASNSSFDAATFELWGALLNGARLVGISKDLALAPEEFAAQIRERGVTAMFLTTALFNQIAQAAPKAFAGVRHLLVGGEAADAKWFRKVLSEGAPARLLNVYGPTESTTFATWHEVGELASDASTVPIGRPLSNTRLYLLDASLEPVPAGVPGELYLGGEGLARDYLRRPALTAERFIPDAFSGEPGARLYRTGDLARFLPDGSVEFVGRVDCQVKVRGFRIELEEIEAVLGTHPLVEAAVVVAREDGGDERRLVAYLVCDAESAPTASELRGFLGAKLPDYMIPSSFVTLESLPLTPNGKLDRKALPAPGQTRPELDEAYVAPVAPSEVALAAVWTEVLGVERVGVHDRFFELGGDSLLAIQVVSKARERGLAVSIHQLFQYPTVAELAAQLSEAEAGDAAPTERIAPFALLADEDRAAIPAGVEDAYPLTRLQAGMVFHSEYDPDTAVYHDIFSFHLRAPLDVELLRATLQALVQRHPVLRTSFDLASYGEPLQIVHERAELPLAIEDLSHLSETEQRAEVGAYVEAERNRGFDWGSAPLMRALVQRRSAGSFQFNLSFHHAILDGWSLSSLLNELFQHYASLLRGGQGALGAPPSIHFREFVALEQAAIRSEEQRRFWLEKLADAPQTHVPRRASIDAGTPPQSQELQKSPDARASQEPQQRRDSHAAHELEEFEESQRSRPVAPPLTYVVPIPAEVSEGLKRLAQAANVTLKSVALAAHMRVLSLLNGSDDCITGVVSNGRPEELDGERMLGLFLNTVPFRLRLPNGTWADLVRATFEAEREMLPFRRYPLPELQRLAGARTLFEVGFNYTHFHVAQGILQLREMEILELEAVSETSFPLLADFDLNLSTSRLQLALKYDAAEFPPEQIEAIGGYYVRALTAAAGDPQERYDARTLLSDAELRQQLEDWNETAHEFPRELCIHQLFEEQVARTPDRVALEFEDERLSFAELNERANRLAHYLRRRGVGAESIVGIMAERSTEMVVAVLGVLKAGGAYVPLDPEYPQERLAFMLRDSGVRVLLTQQRLLERLQGEGEAQPAVAEVVRLDRDWPEIAAESGENPSSETTPDNLLYVVYTSGSTGQPKGIVMLHRPLVNIITFQMRRSGQERSPRTLQYASLSFDASFQELFSTWLVGGTIVLVREEQRRDARQLLRVLSERRVERLFLPFVALQQLAEVATEEQIWPESLREIITAGEQLKTTPALRAFFTRLKTCTLDNQYGPSEAHVVTAYMLAGDPSTWPDLPPVGRPVSNARIYVLGRQLQPLPVGVTGGVYVGGTPLARGYIGRPEQTAERFIPDAFSNEPGARMYMTGDLARYRADGQIEFLGRDDEQVKIRGYRIELGEIEAVLGAHESVGETIVHVREDRPGERRLVAYVVPASKAQPPTTADLRDFLKGRLPDYMLPSVFVMLESLPLNINAKVDRRLLPAPDTTRPETSAAYVPPQTPTEEALARVWSRVLNLERIGAADDFFELGGNSLSATQLVSQLRQTFDIELPLRHLFRHPTVSQLASLIEEHLIAQMDELTDEEAEQLLREEL